MMAATKRSASKSAELGLHKAYAAAWGGSLCGLLLCTVVWAGDLHTDATALHIRVLAASCAACHGTNGNSVGGTPTLAGLQRDYFIQQMRDFRNNKRASTVMFRHARGLTEQEIVQLADYFSRQPRVAAQLPPAAPAGAL